MFTMLETGLRATELCELTLANAHTDQGFLKVLGKGNEERLVPIGRNCQDALEVWKGRNRPQFDPEAKEPEVFLNANGKRMTLRSLEEMISRGQAGRHIPSSSPPPKAHVCHAIPDQGARRYIPASTTARPHQPGDGQAICLDRIRPAGHPRTQAIAHG